MRAFLYIIFLILFLPCVIKSQSDSVKKSSRIHHSFGFDLGYGNHFSAVNYKGEANINYFLDLRRFALKARYGIAPGTSFGNIYGLSFLLGYTTKLRSKFSFHMLIGGNRLFVQNVKYYPTAYGNYILRIDDSDGHVTINIGCIFRIQKNHFLGLDLNSTDLTISSSLKRDDEYGFYKIINVSYNFIFPKSKQ